MVSLAGFLFIYILGGITFLPLLAFALFIYIKGGVEPVLAALQSNKKQRQLDKTSIELSKDSEHGIVKKGWIRVINQYQPKMPELTTSNGGVISGIQSYVTNNESRLKKGVVYGVLKHGTLFCFDTEEQKDVLMILPMQDYQVSLFAPSIEKKTDGELYNKATVIQLTPNGLEKKEKEGSFDSICTLSDEDITTSPTRSLYLTCARNIDKEDWYFGLIDAHHMLHESQKEGPQYEMIDDTHFTPAALQKLISQVQSTPSHRETAWLNAVMGRIFLSMYKTERLKRIFETKIRTKIEKTKRPTFLDEINVRRVDVGDSVPYITEPRLLSFSANGEVIVEAKLEYHGGLTVEIETDFNWSYSSRMKPIRMHVVLAIQLKKLSGRMMFKLKAPPTNRYWTAFFEMPEMDLEITPVVADKQIKFNIVTNAIESRIREVIAETMVLPNMTDTAFCPSNGKGGIFGEYKKVQVQKVPGETELIRKEDAPSIKETPTVPDSTNTKAPASDALKLKNRGAQSVTSLIPEKGNDLLESKDPMQPYEASYSDIGDTNSDFEQHPLDGGLSVSTSNNKWSKISQLRRRSKVLAEDEEEENNTEKNSLLTKISNLIPADNRERNSISSDTTSVHSGNSTTSSKKEFIMNMAENLLTKKSEKKMLISSKNISSTPPPLPPVKMIPPEKPSRKESQSDDTLPIEKPPLPPRKHSLPIAHADKTLLDDESLLKRNENDDGSLTVPPPLPTTPRPKRSPDEL